jgi:hypothetical protein
VSDFFFLTFSCLFHSHSSIELLLECFNLHAYFVSVFFFCKYGFGHCLLID